MDSGSTPQGIGSGHTSDQSFDRGDGRAARRRAPGELGPVLAEAPPLPPQNGVGSNDHERLPPPGPNLGQPDPEEAIRRAKLGPGQPPLVYGKLLSKSEVFKGELLMAAAEEGEETQQVEQEGDHRGGSLFESGRQINQLAPGLGFGEGQALVEYSDTTGSSSSLSFNSGPVFCRRHPGQYLNQFRLLCNVRNRFCSGCVTRSF